jgi:hypothetical protein
MTSRPSLKTIAGLGVSRGRFPGPTALGCSGTSHDCDPRDETASPVPGTIGVSVETSLGVAENAFPAASTTAMYDVSSAASGGPSGARGPVHEGAVAARVTGSPGGGISGQARSSWMSARRAAP